MFNGKLKYCLTYFLEDANFGGNFWNSYPYIVWENSKFETDTSKLGGHAPPVLTESTSATDAGLPNRIFRGKLYHLKQSGANKIWCDFPLTGHSRYIINGEPPGVMPIDWKLLSSLRSLDKSRVTSAHEGIPERWKAELKLMRSSSQR